MGVMLAKSKSVVHQFGPYQFVSMPNTLPPVSTPVFSSIEGAASRPTCFCVHWGAWTDLAAATMALRQEVFAQEQSLPATELQDEQDAQALHVVLLGQHAELVACARLAPVAFGRWMIGYVAVGSAYRGKGAATLVLQVLLDHAQGLGLQSVLLHAQDHAVRLYTRLGFCAVGEPSEVRGTPHQPMVWTAPDS